MPADKKTTQTKREEEELNMSFQQRLFQNLEKGEKKQSAK